MVQLKITPFQDAHVGLEPYRPEAAPIFKTVFDPPPEFPQLGALARPCEEADVALLLDNRRDKPVSAIHYTWTQTFQSGYSSTRSLFSYGYRVEECRAVIGSRKRLLVTPETSVSESLLEQVLADNSGLLGSGGPPIVHWHEAVEWRFELLALIFEDGERVGPAAERLADRIQCERIATEYVDAKLRIAHDEGRDVTSVLESLKPPPHSRQDLMAEAMHHELVWRKMDAKMGRVRVSSRRLPPLPNFYRHKD